MSPRTTERAEDFLFFIFAVSVRPLWFKFGRGGAVKLRAAAPTAIVQARFGRRENPWILPIS